MKQNEISILVLLLAVFHSPLVCQGVCGIKKKSKSCVQKWSEMVRKLVTFFDTFCREGRGGGCQKNWSEKSWPESGYRNIDNQCRDPMNNGKLEWDD